ncbi:unnamed protein product [Closterium sp. Yama58-4]|nr:unnamed protein product [Closterium sp. Yama58-4]
MEAVVEGKDFSFPREEEKVLRLWERLDAFHEQLRRTEGLPEYVFYDGPPFATGLPHYGHILAGTIKDVVTRYQTATGHHVTRRFGWDCHGLPVEYEIDQKLNVKSREDVMKMGIDVYNEECRSIVMRYSSEWRDIITRVGRWIDFDNDYKTLDAGYMESCWWVFSQLYAKGLVYRGFKVMPFSTACNTPLSNFEAGLNYKDVSDPAVVVTFPLHGDADGAALVAWTTTPWTLPSNLALCVNPAFSYCKVRNRDTGAVLMLAQSRLCALPGRKKAKGEAKVEAKMEAKAEGKAAGEEKGGKAGGGEKGKGGKGGGKKGGGSKEQSGGAAAAAGGGGVEGLDESLYEVIATVTGADLVGLTYEPMFPYYKDAMPSAFRVVADGFVTDDSGTGVVHCAPAFGEDDYRVCLVAGVISKGEAIPNPVDDDGRFTDKVTDFKGQYVKDADKPIIAMLKEAGRVVSVGSIMHSYPFCWRSDTPLIYRAVPSWFIAVEAIKPALLESNAGTQWVPDYVKEKRFHNWLENARDWAVSRSRFWGTPLPIWANEDFSEIKVVGSIAELEALGGERVTDLHRHKIDHITIPSSKGPDHPPLKRIEDVFDCWFESGSMPYAYIHYPFENRELFEKNFPGHFIAEGLDQTRGWFYTLMVLSTALFNKPAFRNLICNGLVLAEDGKKMSKRLRNYPPPMDVVGAYGADALRLYLINSPVVRAEPLRFKKDGVFAVVRDVFLPWYNAYRFLVQNTLRLTAEGLPPFQPMTARQLAESSNVLDVWIHSASQSLAQFVRAEMDAYRLYTVVPYLVRFIDSLTNVYVRFNRKRLKGRTSDHDCRFALSSLFHVLLRVCKAMAPFTPFFTEAMYQNLRKALPQRPAAADGEGGRAGGLGGVAEDEEHVEWAEESVHFCCFPSSDQHVDERTERSVERMMKVIDLARNIRERNNRPLKTPLREMVVVHPDAEFLEDITGKLCEYVREELNVRSVLPCADTSKYTSVRAEPDFSVLGRRVGRAMGAVAKAVKEMDAAAIAAMQLAGEVTVAGHTLAASDIKVVRDFKAPEGSVAGDMDAAGDGEVLVVLDLRADTDLLDAGTAREVVNRVQKLRKRAGLEPSDAVEAFIHVHEGGEDGKEGAESAEESALQRILAAQAEYIREALGAPLLSAHYCPSHAVVLASECYSRVAGATFTLTLTRPALCFSPSLAADLCNGDAAAATAVQVALMARDPAKLKVDIAAAGGKVQVAVEGVGQWVVEQGSHLFLSVSDFLLAHPATRP